MKPLGLFCVAALLSGAATAQPIQLYGTIGKAPVFLDLNRNGDTVSGWYVYLKVGKQIRLEGKLDHRGFFQIEEYTASTNTRTGTFTGRVSDNHWAGNWRNARGRSPHPIAFDGLKSKLKEADGHYRCSTKRQDIGFGDTFTHAIDLTLAKGHVKALSLTRTIAAQGGDKQSCQIAASDLRQQPAPVGIVLRAKTDQPKSSQHCTLRLYGAGDYLIVKPGNPSQSGDDCRAAGDASFCSPRAFWADLIVNRKTQVCKSVE